jgi:hypothetical protein
MFGMSVAPHQGQSTQAGSPSTFSLIMRPPPRLSGTRNGTGDAVTDAPACHSRMNSGSQGLGEGAGVMAHRPRVHACCAV